MEILELHLKSYGKFNNHKITLNPGMNIIYGGNETGKSTIHSFIRSMFFGLSRGRGKAAKTDEYQIRQPWNTPGAFLGSMRVQENGEVYRIDRCFDRSTDPLQIVCETHAQESVSPQEDLDKLLGGISENAFVNTVFVPQAHAETDETFAEELRKYMVNSDSTLDGQLDITRALQTLRKKKKAFEQKKKKEEEALETQISGKQEQAEMIRSDLERLKQQKEMMLRSRNKLIVRDTPDADWEENNAPVVSKGVRILLELLCLVAGILALTGAYVMEDAKLRLFLGVFGVIFLGMVFLVHVLFADRENLDWEQDMPVSEQEYQQMQYLQNEIRNKEELYRKLQAELEALYHSHVRLDGADTEIAALNLAIDRICELTAGIYRQSGGTLNEHASRILKELTNGKYDRIVLDETGEVRIHTASRVLGLHQVSGGTMQQIYFALRMAAGELLCEGRSLPVVLDETFALYDDRRLEAALRWLKNSKRQVILFTCQKREREILSKIK